MARADGLQVWIYQFKIALHPTIPEPAEGAEPDETAQRFAEAVTAIWRGQAEIDRFNELVLRAGDDLAAGGDSCAHTRNTCGRRGFPYSQAHIER